MKQKILFVITKSNWGGAQRYVYDLATNLSKNDFEISVALGGSGILAEKLEKSGLKIINIPHLERDVGFINDIKAFVAFFKIFKKEVPDIVHLNSSKTGGLGALALFFLKKWPFKQKIKSVFTVHGWAFNEDRGFIAKAAIFLVQWLTVLFCDKIIILSRYDYRQGVKMPLTTLNKFELIPLGIAQNFEALQKSDAILQLKKHNELVSDKIILVGTIAELTKNKGLNYLIEAAQQLYASAPKESFQIIVIGGGEDYEKTQTQIANYKLQNKVLLLGFVQDAAKYLKAFDIFILASLKEGLPYTLLEAVCAELPIIATSTGGIPDIILNNKNGLLVPSKNSKALAEALKILINNKSKRIPFGQFGKNLVENKFTLDKMILATKNLYICLK